jgi:hypothetical protein
MTWVCRDVTAPAMPLLTAPEITPAYEFINPRSFRSAQCPMREHVLPRRAMGTTATSGGFRQALVELSNCPAATAMARNDAVGFLFA